MNGGTCYRMRVSPISSCKKNKIKNNNKKNLVIDLQSFVWILLFCSPPHPPPPQPRVRDCWWRVCCDQPRKPSNCAVTVLCAHQPHRTPCWCVWPILFGPRVLCGPFAMSLVVHVIKMVVLSVLLVKFVLNAVLSLELSNFRIDLFPGFLFLKSDILASILEKGKKSCWSNSGVWSYGIEVSDNHVGQSESHQTAIVFEWKSQMRRYRIPLMWKAGDKRNEISLATFWWFRGPRVSLMRKNPLETFNSLHTWEVWVKGLLLSPV